MSTLFDPIKVGPITFRNRFVRSATQDWLSHSDGQVSDAQLALYEQLAAGGVGLINTGHTYISHPLGRAANPQNAFYHDRFIESHKKLVEVVHRHGAKIFLQLAHAGRQTLPENIDGQMPVAPSDMFDEKGQQIARSMTSDEIERLMEDYTSAAGRAKRAGFDGVQLHMAHGYLLAQFLSPYTNHRDDEYGGSIDNRISLLCAVTYRVKSAVGRQFPVFAKLNTTDGITAETQLSLDDAVYTANMIAEHGIDAIETSGGTVKETRLVMAKPGILKPALEAYFAPAAKQVKAAVKVPVILVGGLRSTAVMEDIINSGTADMISMSRPFVREPDLVNKLAAGQPKATCVSCNACFNPQGLKCRYEGPVPQ